MSISTNNPAAVETEPSDESQGDKTWNVVNKGNLNRFF
jgi:hypothetical protein